MFSYFKRNGSTLEYGSTSERVLPADLNMAFHQTSTRAGRYIKQPTGYHVFVPAALPPNRRVRFDDTFMDITHSLGRSRTATE